MYKKLFSAKKIGSMEVPNRIVMTAMGNISQMKTVPYQKQTSLFTAPGQKAA